MKKALFLAAILAACAFVPLAVVDAAQDANGAEVDVWYYYRGIAPYGEEGVFKMVRMDKMETTWPTCEITLTDIPEHPEYKNFTFSHWAIYVDTSYDTYKLGEYSDEEIHGLTISYTPEKLYEIIYMYYVYGVYSYDSPDSGSESKESAPLLLYIALIVGLACIFYVLVRSPE